MDYQYPISYEWNTEETVDVLAFYECIEKAYEKGVSRTEFMATYRRFKEIIPGKSDEKNLCDEFEEASGYSAYRVVKKAKDASEENWILMKK